MPKIKEITRQIIRIDKKTSCRLSHSAVSKGECSSLRADWFKDWTHGVMYRRSEELYLHRWSGFDLLLVTSIKRAGPSTFLTKTSIPWHVPRKYTCRVVILTVPYGNRFARPLAETILSGNKFTRSSRGSLQSFHVSRRRQPSGRRRCGIHFAQTSCSLG